MTSTAGRPDWELPLDELFPTKGAIPEALQIGRGQAIEDLTGRIVDGDDIITIEPRRVGKSSTIGRGALEHIRNDYGGVVAQVDLRLGGVQDAAGLANALLTTALASGGGTPLRKETAGRIVRRTGRFVNNKRVEAAAQLAGEEGRLGTLRALATMISGQTTGLEQLERVLGALDHEAASHRRPVVVFIDEIQDLGGDRWRAEGREIQQELERAMRTPDRLVSFVYAGSERSAMERLFEAGMPLHFEGERFALPPISPFAWQAGLTQRFAQDGREIQAVAVDRILDATHGQPLRTMQVCRSALRMARRQAMRDITGALLDDAIAQARGHPSWRDAE